MVNLSRKTDGFMDGPRNREWASEHAGKDGNFGRERAGEVERN